MKRIYAFTDEELHELVNDNSSKVFIKKSVLHISLHAYHFADLKQSLCEILDESINHFKPELNGIILSYRNIKVLNDIGRIINDDSRIYIDVQVDYYVFSPEVGCILTGVVNKKSSDHVGCLVHKLFNVSIPRPEEGSWYGETVELGQKISFCVQFMDLDLNLPYIRGKFVEPSLSVEVAETAKKKKKKNKEKLNDEDDRPLAGAVAQSDAVQSESADQQKVKKKKKKDKKNKEKEENQQQDIPFQTNVFSNSDMKILHEPLEEKTGKDIISRSSEAKGTDNKDMPYNFNISADFSESSILACSTQQDEHFSKKKKKKKNKVKDNEHNSAIDINESEISQEQVNSSHGEGCLDTEEKSTKVNKKKRELISDDLAVKMDEDAEQTGRKMHKKRKKHKHPYVDASLESCERHTEESMENYQLPAPEDSKTTIAQLAHKSSECSSDTQISNLIPRKTKKRQNQLITKTQNIQYISSKVAGTSAIQVSKNTTDMDSSFMDCIKQSPGKQTNKRKLSESDLDNTPDQKKKKLVRFSNEIITNNPEAENMHIDSDPTNEGLQSKKPKKKKIPKTESDSDLNESPNLIATASLGNLVSSSIYSGVSMANSLDRKRKKPIKPVDEAALKRPLNVSPSLSSWGTALKQANSKINTQEESTSGRNYSKNVGLSSPSSSEERFYPTVQTFHSPDHKPGGLQTEDLFLSSTKPLTQKENISKKSEVPGTPKKLDTSGANISDFNSSINIKSFELPDISQLIARLNTSENTVAHKEEKPSKTIKTDKKENKKKKEGAETATKSKHKEHKKDKKHKDKKKEKDKKKKEHKSIKGDKDKKKTKQNGPGSDLTELSRKLLHDFLKKQTNS